MPSLNKGLRESGTINLIGSDLAKPHTQSEKPRPTNRARAAIRLRVAVPLLILGLAVACAIGLYVGYQPLDLVALNNDPIARAVFFRLRLPRVVMAGLVGASLAMVGAALQALFRNPLADPFTLGVSGEVRPRCREWCVRPGTYRHCA